MAIMRRTTDWGCAAACVALQLCVPAVSATSQPSFQPTVENPTSPSVTAPAGMVWIPGGEFSMGAQDPGAAAGTVGMQATTDSRPIHRVYVDGFWMDKTEVTN